jgi:4-amino-4-deoxy-L-arabinose transferase-like glycosyltransferase
MLATLLLLTGALVLAAYGAWALRPNRSSVAVESIRRILASPDFRNPYAIPAPGTGTRADGNAARSRTYLWVLTAWTPALLVTGALLLRTIGLSASPPGFFVDEASNAIDAYSIIHTLRDQHGVFLPTLFQALGDWRGSLYIYLDAPFAGVLGLSEIAVRLGAAVIGALTVWLVYLFVSKAVNPWVGVISAFLLATSPWHLMQSRIGWDVITIPFVTALCLTFLYYGFDRPRLLPLAFLAGALGMYTYFSGRLFFPLFCLAWIVIYAPQLWARRRASAIGLLLGGIAAIPAFVALLNGTLSARFNQTAPPNQSFGDRLTMVWSNYLAHFQPGFLFDTSTDWILRLYVRGFGMLYGVEAPFLIIGVIAMLARHRRTDVLFLVWFLIYPISAALVGPPVSTRSITGVVVFQIAVAEGVFLTVRGVALGLGRLRYGRAVVVATFAVLVATGLATAAGFFTAYLRDYPAYSAGWDGWQAGPREIVDYFEHQGGRYDVMVMSADFNAADELLSFYSAAYPDRCATCVVVNIDDRRGLRAHYRPGARELWAVAPQQLQHFDLARIAYRIVHHISYPNGQTSFFFIATGPPA